MAKRRKPNRRQAKKNQRHWKDPERVTRRIPVQVKTHPPKEVVSMIAASYKDIIAHLQTKVIGQPRALTQIGRSLRIAQVGLRDHDKPIAILFFAGPTGTGKSETVCALAEAIHGDRDYLCRVDCNLLADSFTANSLSGSPPGYVGSAESDTLLNKKLIEGKPGFPGILVLEEIEKAHPKVFQTLLGIFDKGELRLNNGKVTIDFTNTIIVITSNVGARELADVADQRVTGFRVPAETRAQLSGEERKAIVFREMKRLFSPEFINRLDDTVVFRWLDEPELLEIVTKFLMEFAGKLARFPYFFDSTVEAKQFLVDNGYDLRYGARPLKRAIRKYVEDPIAEMIADGVPDYALFRAYVQDGEFHIGFELVPELVPDDPVEDEYVDYEPKEAA